VIARVRDDGSMDRPRDPPAFPSDALPPGGRCRISEAEWAAFLELAEPLHQWGGTFLFDETRAGRGALVRAYLRDDSGAARHLCLRFDAARSGAAREAVERVELASRRAADVISAGLGKDARTLADLAAEEAASRAFTDAAEAMYRELLAG
jgi:hypothetical protein